LTFQNTSEDQSEPQNVLEHEEEIEQEEEYETICDKLELADPELEESSKEDTETEVTMR